MKTNAPTVDKDIKEEELLELLGLAQACTGF